MKKQKFNVRMQTPNGIKYEEVDGYTEMIDGIAMGFHKVKIGREKNYWKATDLHTGSALGNGHKTRKENIESAKELIAKYKERILDIHSEQESANKDFA